MTGLRRSRISQLHQSTEPDALPEPDCAGSTEARPRWQHETIARWCAATGRRLPPDLASWLHPGPDGPRLQRTDARLLRLESTAQARYRLGRAAADSINLHVTCYQDASRFGGAVVWLVTPVVPSEAINLLGWPFGWPNGSPLADLVVQLINDFGNPASWEPDAHLGTLVLLPTAASDSFMAPTDDVRLMELYSSDANPSPCRGELHDRLRRIHRHNERELLDLVKAIGHRLPLWPAGCATTELVAAWALDPTSRISGRLPPLEPVRAFAQRCESVARNQEDTLADSLRALGSAWWTISARHWAPGIQRRGALPEKSDPAIWQLPVQFQVPTAVPFMGPLFDGLDWLMEQPHSPRLAEDALAIFGDPSSAGTAVIDLDSLPRHVRALLERRIRPSEPPPASLRARRVVEALDQHPDAGHGIDVAEWIQPGGPVWCAKPEGTSLFAFHVSRRAAAPAESAHTSVGHRGPVPGPAAQSRVGRALEVAFLPTAPVDGATRAAVGFVITDSDQLLLLPAIGSADKLAAAIEHMTWHEGQRGLPVGLPPVQSEHLANAVAARLQTGPALVPWEQLSMMVGDHADERPHCHYCRQQEALDT